MALGDDRGNKIYENTYYSRLRFRDYDKKLVLGFKFRSGMLVAEISQEKDNFQYDSLVDIFITSTKAKILLNEIQRFEDDIATGIATPDKGYGINAGLGDIVSVLAFHTTESGGKAVLIGKVDGNGSYTKSVDYVFNSNDFHYGLEWNNISNMEVSKKYYNDTEYELFKDAVRQFSEHSSGASGYAVADITKYDYRAILNKMNPIFDKLGIERTNNRNGSGNGASSNNYFMNSPESRGSTHKSYDEVDDELPFD